MEREKRDIIIQKLKRQEMSNMDLAIRYYKILTLLNDIPLGEREIQLIAFIAIKGNISYPDVREEFCKQYKSSSPTINNMISKLKKLNILTKESGRIKVNSKILLNFNNDIVLQITLNG